jgi:hypothetical protein
LDRAGQCALRWVGMRCVALRRGDWGGGVPYNGDLERRERKAKRSGPDRQTQTGFSAQKKMINSSAAQGFSLVD